MLRFSVNFANLLLAGLLVGAMFGIWLGYAPQDLSALAYIEQQQHAIRALNVSMPALGAVTALLTLYAALLARREPARRRLLIGSLLCLVAAGVVTRFVNQPINAAVITWSTHAPPAAWSALRDRWWHWHIVRTLVALAGFALLIAANVAARRPSEPAR